MNEIAQIHLGRQAFTIASDAHKELQSYLHAIEKEVGKKGEEVVKEVENRMAELLAERGVTGEKVVLLEDVKFLKEQLGAPKDFTDKDDEGDDAEESTGDEQGQKRLFRDTDRGIIAGVAAGLAKYLNTDPVFVRIGFVLLTLFWGWGILIYIVLWLIVPEAKSSSNRLQMEGKPVTVQSLKDAAQKADVPGAANRAGRTVGRVLEKIGKILLVIIGICFVLFGFAMFLAPASGVVYLLLNGAQAFGETIFPIGATETWLVISGFIATAAVAILCILLGLAIVRRKWSLPGWAVATLIAIALAGSSIGLGLGFDAAPDIAKRVDALKHTQEVTTPAFKKVDLAGNQTSFTFVPSDTFSVDFNYFSKQKYEASSMVKIDGDTLRVDTTAMKQDDNCWIICFGDERWSEIVIHAPTLDAVTVAGTSTFTSNKPLSANSIITAGSGADVNLMGVYVEKTEVEVSGDSLTTTLRLFNSTSSGFDRSIYVTSGQVNIAETGTLKLKTKYSCLWLSPAVQLNVMPKQIVINDEAPVTTNDDLDKRKSEESPNFYNCVGVNPVAYY